MFKKALMFVAMALVVFAVKGGVSQAAAVADNSVTICHGTNSVSNPYTRPTVNADAADGNTSNDKGQGDHSTHTGPVATSPEVAQNLKNSKQAWGDIIPPHDNYAGLNWTVEGQAIYNNNCEYVNPNFEQPLISFEVACPQDATGKVVVTLTNDGQADGNAIVNGQAVAVAAGTTVKLDFALGQNIKIEIDKQTVYDQMPVCGGRGGSVDEPVTPPAAQVVAPKAGVSAGNGAAASLMVLLAASVASIAFGAQRLRKSGR